MNQNNVNFDFYLTEHDRILSNLISIGTIKEIDYKKARVRVSVGELVTAWIPWIVARAGESYEWNALEKGEQVLLLAPSGDLSQAVVVGSIYKTPPPTSNTNEAADIHEVVYKDGTALQYHQGKKELKIKIQENGKPKVQIVMDGKEGNINIIATNNVSIIADKNISIKAERVDFDVKEAVDVK